MRRGFPKVYRSFAEFEREELNRFDVGVPMDDMLDEMLAQELDFDEPGPKRSRRRDDLDD